MALRRADAAAAPVPRRPAKAPTLTGQAYHRIEELIVTLKLAPGAALSEQELAADLGLGRTPVREALQRLAQEGLIVVLPRKGILVAPTDPAQQLLVLEVRRELERLLARAGAERASAEERAQFRRIAEGMDAAARRNDDIAFMRLDRELNALLAVAAHNDYATRTMRLLNGHSRRFWYLHYKETADLPRCARLHAAEARAIASGNADRAAAASDRLMDYVERFTRDAAAEVVRRAR